MKNEELKKRIENLLEELEKDRQTRKADSIYFKRVGDDLLSMACEYESRGIEWCIEKIKKWFGEKGDKNE